MFVNFFIRRPVFASVCALLIVLAGAAVIPSLPIAQFPNLAPPQVGVTSVYIGASAQTVESAVTIPLEQQINGAEGMKYITSTSGNDGTSQVLVTFDLTRNPDLATVDIQNRVNTAQGRLPGAVKAVGITTAEDIAELCVRRRRVFGQRTQLLHAVHEQLSRRLRAGFAEADSGRRGCDHFRRAQILDAAVAGSGTDGRARADGARRGERTVGTKRRGGGWASWAATGNAGAATIRSACGPWGA